MRWLTMRMPDDVQVDARELVTQCAFGATRATELLSSHLDVEVLLQRDQASASEPRVVHADAVRARWYICPLSRAGRPRRSTLAKRRASPAHAGGVFAVAVMAKWACCDAVGKRSHE